MSYLEMISRALKNRSVNSLAKAWGVKQKTLDRYVKGETLPDYSTALIMAKEAGIGAGEAMELLAAEEMKRKAKPEIISTSFEMLLRAANACWIRFPAVS